MRVSDCGDQARGCVRHRGDVAERIRDLRQFASDCKKVVTLAASPLAGAGEVTVSKFPFAS